MTDLPSVVAQNDQDIRARRAQSGRGLDQMSGWRIHDVHSIAAKKLTISERHARAIRALAQQPLEKRRIRKQRRILSEHNLSLIQICSCRPPLTVRTRVCTAQYKTTTKQAKNTRSEPKEKTAQKHTT